DDRDCRETHDLSSAVQWQSSADVSGRHVFHCQGTEMIQSIGIVPDPKLDLVIERLIEIPRIALWDAWTKPEHVKQWFAPEPWSVAECEIDLHAGGVFRTLLRSSEG